MTNDKEIMPLLERILSELVDLRENVAGIKTDFKEFGGRLIRIEARLEEHDQLLHLIIRTAARHEALYAH